MMAMKTCMPIPLLLQDTLLASTWTWLALGLATIATFIRAFFARPRLYEPLSLPPPSPPPPTNQSNMLGKENEPAVADKKREAIVGKENDCMKEEVEEEEEEEEEEEAKEENMLWSYDDLFSGVLPLGKNCMQNPAAMIQPKKRQLHFIIREEESKHVSHSWLSRSSVCFEKQFGWDKLLETKLGMSWACHIDPIFGRINWGEISMATIEEDHQGKRSTAIIKDDDADDVDHERCCVVRLWSPHH